MEILIILMILMLAKSVSAAAIDTAEYWIQRNQNGDKILLTSTQINRLNAQMLNKDSYSGDLVNYPLMMSADKVNALIKEAEDKHLNTMHFVKDNVKVQYAVTVDRGDIRLLPQSWNGDNFDELQGTAIDPAEPVAVLTEAGEFAFVQSRNYIGWIDKAYLAFTTRDIWLNYVNPGYLAVVITNKKNINVNGKDILFQMGAVIPLINKNTAKLPLSVNGMLKEIKVQIANDETLHIGYLPCTVNNFIRQSFKFLGDVYGWGGLYESVDCSAFVGDVYKSMGINLPRDADRQEAAMPIFAVFNNVTIDERYDIVRRAPIGSLLFTPTHVMMKLGVDDQNNPLVIHASSAGNQVRVSDLSYHIDKLTGIGFAK